MKKSILILLLVATFGCSNSDSLKKTEDEVQTVNQTDKPALEAKVDVFEISTIKTLYVINPKVEQYL